MGSAAREARIGRVLDEILTGRARGESFDEAALLAEHADIADELRKHLELLGDLRPETDRITDLINRGILKSSEDRRYLAVFGPYMISGYRGRGGMGVVLKAYEAELDRPVALKILRPELAEDAAAVQRFIREAKAAAALRHPNIITIHAVGRSNGTHYIAMEFIEGPTLAEVIRQHGPPTPVTPMTRAPDYTAAATQDSPACGPMRAPNPPPALLPTQTIRRIFRELLTGLAAAHEAGLVHRDIKPSNILLDGYSNASLNGRNGWPIASAVGSRIDDLSDALPFALKIADFGLARILSSRTRVTLADSVLGTPEYMSPEQARGDRDIDQRTDLYSAGVVLYELLTGRTPFRADSPTAVIHQILHSDPPDPRRLRRDADPHLASLALRLMSKSPDDRYESAREALAALEAHKRVSSPEKRRRVRRRRLQVAAGLVLFAGAVALVSWLGREQPPTNTAAVEQPIRDVRLSEPSQGEPFILARYGDDPGYKTFRARAKAVRAVELVDLDGRGDKIVLAGLADAPDRVAPLVAFDPQGNPIWDLELSSARQWPDCGPSGAWDCNALAVGDLDGRPGDEIVAVAHDRNNYATGIFVIDPRTREINSTFWHMGQFSHVEIVPNFLETGRPAIVAWGLGNKLDGFGSPHAPRPYTHLPDEDEPRTKYDLVNVLVVLDPENMDGLGPPRTPLVSWLSPARPVAYAFLDMPPDVANGTYVPDGQTQPVSPKSAELGMIVNVAYAASTPDAEPLLRISVKYEISDSTSASVLLFVDRYLQIQYIEHVSSGPGVRRDIDYWKQRWRPIIRNGEYVEE